MFSKINRIRRRIDNVAGRLEPVSQLHFVASVEDILKTKNINDINILEDEVNWDRLFQDKTSMNYAVGKCVQAVIKYQRNVICPTPPSNEYLMFRSSLRIFLLTFGVLVFGILAHYVATKGFKLPW